MRSANTTTKDMTSGSTMKLILGFAVPLLMGMLFQQVYSLVDTIIVGRTISVQALAAVGVTGGVMEAALRTLPWRIGTCSGRCDRKYQLSDHRLLSGNLQRICAPCRAAVRRKGL